jgi:EAL domain-containing protein (putative c-di-GMP-specific phosphodiesterase class I)
LLLSLGCELAQGFGIARPMPVEALDDWLQSWNNGAHWAA